MPDANWNCSQRMRLLGHLPSRPSARLCEAWPQFQVSAYRNKTSLFAVSCLSVRQEVHPEPQVHSFAQQSESLFACFAGCRTRTRPVKLQGKEMSHEMARGRAKVAFTESSCTAWWRCFAETNSAERVCAFVCVRIASNAIEPLFGSGCVSTGCGTGPGQFPLSGSPNETPIVSLRLVRLGRVAETKSRSLLL